MSEILYHTATTAPIVRGIQMVGRFVFEGIERPAGSWYVIHVQTGARYVLSDPEWADLRLAYGADVVKRSHGV